MRKNIIKGIQIGKKELNNFTSMYYNPLHIEHFTESINKLLALTKVSSDAVRCKISK